MLHTSLLPYTHARAEISYLNRNNSSSGECQSTMLLTNKQNGALKLGHHDRIRRCCSVSCLCRCHRPPTLSYQPWPLRTVRQVLSLFMTKAHWESGLCDDEVCRDISRQNLALVYQIPLIHRVIWLRLAWTSTFGPGASLHLRVARVVTNYQAFRVIEVGTPERLRYLLKEKIAFPTDITPFGRSLLHVS